MRALVFKSMGRVELVNAYMDGMEAGRVVGPDGKTLCVVNADYPRYSMMTRGLLGGREESLVIVRDGVLVPMTVAKGILTDLKYDADLWDRTVRKGVATAHFKLHRVPDWRRFLPIAAILFGAMVIIVIIAAALKAGA